MTGVIDEGPGGGALELGIGTGPVAGLQEEDGGTETETAEHDFEIGEELSRIDLTALIPAAGEDDEPASVDLE